MRESGRARELEARIGVLLAQQHALSGEVVGCLAELDALDGWQGEGYRSMAHWLSVRGKVTLAEGRAFQTAATRLANVGSIHADALAGQLSVGVLAMAARVATPENEALVAKVVRDTVPTQAARIFAKYRESRKQDEPEPGPIRMSTSGRSIGSTIWDVIVTTWRSTRSRVRCSRRRGRRRVPPVSVISTRPTPSSAAA